MKIYKPNHFLYTALLLGFLLLTAGIFLIPMNNECFTIVTGIGCGGITSIIIAWLVDAANCRMNNQRSNILRKRYFHSLKVQYSNILVLIKKIYHKGNSEEKRNWIGWITNSDDAISDSEARALYQDLGQLITKLENIIHDGLMIEALHMLPEDEIDALSQLHQDLLHVFRMLEYGNEIDNDDIKLMLKACSKDARKSGLLKPLDEFEFNRQHDFIEFIRRTDNIT